MTAVDFPDPDHGFALDGDGPYAGRWVIVTADGGSTWHVAGLPPLCGASVCGYLRAASDTHVYLYGAPTPSTPGYAESTDGGRTWTSDSSPVIDLDPGDSETAAVRVVASTDRDGHCRRAVRLQEEEPTGAWHDLTGPPMSPGTCPGGLRRRGNTVLLLVSGPGAHPVAATSNDGGRTWTEGPVPCPYGDQPTGVDLSPQRLVGVLCEGDTDSGTDTTRSTLLTHPVGSPTWYGATTRRRNGGPGSLVLLDPGSALSSGGGPHIYRNAITRDRGNTWDEQAVPWGGTLGATEVLPWRGSDDIHVLAQQRLFTSRDRGRTWDEGRRIHVVNAETFLAAHP